MDKSSFKSEKDSKKQLNSHQHQDEVVSSPIQNPPKPGKLQTLWTPGTTWTGTPWTPETPPTPETPLTPPEHFYFNF